MKKTFALLLMSILVGSLCSCGSKENTVEEETEGPIIATGVSGEITMDYCRFGKGSKVFVILPGLSIKPVTPSAELIAQGFADFSEEYTVYLFDRRTNLPQGYTIDQMADDTVAIMKSLGIEKADFFGASQGGMILQSIAIRYPEMTGKIVLGSTAARVNETMKAHISHWLELAEKKEGYELNKAISQAIYAPATYQAYEEVLLAAGEDISDQELERFIIMASSISELDLYENLDQLQCDTLVLGCDGDQVTTPEAAREIADKLQCESYFYGKEYGHAVFDEAPDYRGRILDFFLK